MRLSELLLAQVLASEPTVAEERFLVQLQARVWVQIEERQVLALV